MRERPVQAKALEDATCEKPAWCGQVIDVCNVLRSNAPHLIDQGQPGMDRARRLSISIGAPRVGCS